MAALSSSAAVPSDSEAPAKRGGPTITEAELRGPTTSSRTPLDKVETGLTMDDPNDTPLEVIGSTNIYDDEGKIRLIPVRSRLFCFN